MVRAAFTPHQAIRSPAAADYLLLLRCDETGADTDNLADSVPGAPRTMTQTNSPPRVAAVFDPNQTTTGARDFNGSTQYAGRASSDSDHTMFAAGGFSWALWVRPDTLPAASVPIEYGEFGNTDATNIVKIELNSSGGVRVFWHATGPANVIIDTANGLIAAGSYYHIGFVVRPDDDNHQKMECRIYVNGECVKISNNLAPYAGGSSSRWIVGASRDAGSGVGTPGTYFDGRLDDIAVLKWAATHEWFTETYARGICDFVEDVSTQDASAGRGHLREHYVRVLVELRTDEMTNLPRVNLTDVDLTSCFGVDFVDSVEMEESLDDDGAGATVKIAPRWEWFNLAPDVRVQDDTVYLEQAFWKLLLTRRRVKILRAVVPFGTTAEQVWPFWHLVFSGWTLDPQVSEPLGSLRLLGPEAPLQQAWIEASSQQGSNGFHGAGFQPGKDWQFGSGAGVAIETIAQQLIDYMDPARFPILEIDDDGPGTAFVIQLLYLSQANANGRVHPVISGDKLLIEGTTNYNGIKTASATITSETVQTTETSGGALAAESAGTAKLVPRHSYRGGKPSIYVPTSPSWNLFTFNEPPSKSVMQALRDWWGEIGWVCRFEWSEARQEFRLTAYDPTSQPSVSVKLDLIYTARDVAVDMSGQRTAGLVEYASNASKDAVGERQRYAVGHVASKAREGDRYAFRVATGAKSLITSSTEAQKLLNRLLSDIGNLTESIVLEMPDDMRVQVNDVVTLDQALGVYGQPRFVDLLLPGAGSVVGLARRFSRTAARLVLTLGKYPNADTLGGSAARVAHMNTVAGVGSVAGRSLSYMDAPAGGAAVSMGTINGTKFVHHSWSIPTNPADAQRAWKGTEIHMTQSGTAFTPSTSTFMGYEAAPGTRYMMPHSYTGTVYCRLVFVDEQGNRSIPGTTYTFSG